jgi:hypothetical protein
VLLDISFIDIYNGIAKVNYFKKQEINQVVQYTALTEKIINTEDGIFYQDTKGVSRSRKSKDR